MARIEFQMMRSPTGLTDKQWERMAPLLFEAPGGGRPRLTDLGEVPSVLSYLLRTGCG